MNTLTLALNALVCVGVLVGQGTILRRTRRIMADQQEILDSLATLGDDIDAIRGHVSDLERQVSDLQAQISAGTPVTSTDLQPIADKVAELRARLETTSVPAPAPADTDTVTGAAATDAPLG